ncbi:hypothetical protein [Actinomycetospora soli]|uniref:hypothetical protein n=1 Tax=Actinomycetospora soli TaxID=2893887 RepID=UPI001E446DCF|nr:hypothetical protein [Actinomycetospora soli]MCD2191731.1 hypothetical protein [Actinomycetospora soli]
MSTAREKMAAKAARVAQRPQSDAAPVPTDEPTQGVPEPHSPPQTSPAPAGARRQGSSAKVTEQSGMVRTTVDLAPAMHRELRALLADVAADLGRTRVTASDAHRVLVRRLLNDPSAREQFVADCREQL